MPRTGNEGTGCCAAGNGLRQCVPGTLCQLLHSRYQAVDTGCSVPGTGYSTQRTRFPRYYVPYTKYTGPTHHVPGVRYLELALAVAGARYQVLDATHCALHDDTMRLAAGTGVAR